MRGMGISHIGSAKLGNPDLYECGDKDLGFVLDDHHEEGEKELLRKLP
jgi:hypothetical protein